jgi:hypothetical protein
VPALDKKTDAGFASMKEEFSQINTAIFTLFGASIALIVGLIGYIFWDRRSAM